MTLYVTQYLLILRRINNFGKQRPAKTFPSVYSLNKAKKKKNVQPTFSDEIIKFTNTR